ncbi:glycosyltransferase family 4 protein [Carnobacterium inhibens]|uniref:Glycosyl transferase family 1 domain-containing protein n=1 Tax=Carnobacterium inhibens subsp. gilichinskyi TaxID=1266845 RepID=U5SCQ6_9LACT|nr:glycosyltransferase family 4 protein [Carnobacterium inhibens]AGY82831.1 hypothetical protein Q783_07010 [Carnobacterium inhibens subsp. gilichinskyi]
MNLSMLRLYCGQSGIDGYYNSQEVGLARELAAADINVYIMVLNDKITKVKEKKIAFNITIVYIPAKSIANHGFFNCKILKEYNIDVVHLQSDNQAYAPNVMKYCKNNNIKFYNYVGTIYSDSNNFLKKIIMNIISKRNISYFRKYKTFVKTPYVSEQLLKKNIITEVSPVGLDLEIIPEINLSKEELRLKLNLPLEKKVIIFVGRLETYKKPMEVIELMKNLDENYYLIMIGKGSLKKIILKNIDNLKLNHKIMYIESIANNKIHEYYKCCDYFVNCNDKEIFGMSILEAMYQGCTVFAKSAPGPDYILEDGVSGYIVHDPEDLSNAIITRENLSNEKITERIKKEFVWRNTAKRILNYLQSPIE